MSLRSLFSLKYVLPAAVLLMLYGFYTYQLHVEVAVYNRKWVDRELHAVPSLSGCFNPERVSPAYNISEAVYGARQTEIQSGMTLKMGMGCYDLAGTVQSRQKHDTTYIPPDQRTQYHSYWRNDLAPFGPRQDWMLKSFFATQNVNRSRLILWSNGDLRSNHILRDYLQRYPESFTLKIADKISLARGTALEGSEMLSLKDQRAWLDSDLVRLLVLWHYGGVWVDMDTLLTRDLDPLLEHEFVTQWDCYDNPYSIMNNALIRFRQHSPYLCEAFHIMATSPPPRQASTDWGSLLYLKLWSGLVAESIPPFKILPFCFSDGRACRLDNRLPDPFIPDDSQGRWTKGLGSLGMEEGGPLDHVLGKVFAVHLHNQWEKEFPRGGWVQRLLLNRYDEKLGVPPSPNTSRRLRHVR